MIWLIFSQRGFLVIRYFKNSCSTCSFHFSKTLDKPYLLVSAPVDFWLSLHKKGIFQHFLRETYIENTLQKTSWRSQQFYADLGQYPTGCSGNSFNECNQVGDNDNKRSCLNVFVFTKPFMKHRKNTMEWSIILCFGMLFFFMDAVKKSHNGKK